jgi:hypothetical protein
MPRTPKTRPQTAAALPLCAPCVVARDDPHYIVPRHVVHPKHGKPRTFDVRGLAICPDCRTLWHATRRNTFEIIAQQRHV